MRQLILGALTAAVTLAGCGKSTTSSLTPVKGSITLNGKPISKDAVVSFWLDDHSNGFVGAGRGGHYVLGNRETGLGALPGSYRVSIACWEVAPDELRFGSDGVPAIPLKYFEINKSGLTAVVPEASRGVVIDFSLEGTPEPPKRGK